MSKKKKKQVKSPSSVSRASERDNTGGLAGHFGKNKTIALVEDDFIDLL